MQVKIFTIPIIGGERINEEMNVFLRSKKVLQIEHHLVGNDQGAVWCFYIKYLDDFAQYKRPGKIDYRELLDEASFMRFSKMREIRKRIAREEAIPAYAVFTDEELAGLARIEGDLTEAKMQSVKGIGEQKVQKYGSHFIGQSSGNEKG